MQVVKALVGGVIGGCLGAYVANLFGPVRGAAGPWLILLAGLGAGLGARLVCGANRNFMTGVVSAISAIMGVTLVTYMSAAVALQSTDEMEAPLPVARSVEADEASADESEVDPAAETDESEATDGDAEEDGESEDAGADQTDQGENDREEMEFVPPTKAPYELPKDTLSGNVTNSNNADRSQRKSMDLIANAASALLAFVIGTGSAAPSRRDPEEGQSDGTDSDDA